MLKRLNYISNIIIFFLVGANIVGGIYQYMCYKNNPRLYTMQSAPWYTGILIDASITAIFILGVLIIKMIIRRKLANKRIK